MLQIKGISKEYRTGELVQRALDGVSLSLRDNEFVAVLGPSGSGKTTLLNIIGGLDRYDDGELIINSVSTKRYRDRDWDAYRNHTIGFVFQSYNLIPHQSILANVELALTISGISRKERKARAKKALNEVGLGDQMHKRPNQLSGGQMQRVAIARALVNNPDILLADEPTGALDSETGVAVMDLLKRVAKKRLVVMVTHNSELAERYATRIIKLRDGRVTDDSNPYNPPSKKEEPEHKRMGRASMSLLTALSLSFNNLRTKKGRTFLTSFAGSIGIIGIALILALSQGVNGYITDIQKSTMTSYPITIEAQAMDMSGLMEIGMQNAVNGKPSHELDAVYSNGSDMELASGFTSGIKENNLTEFKGYLDDPESEIHEYIGENGIIYSYDTKFSVYTHDPDGALVNTDGSTLEDDDGMVGNMTAMAKMNPMGEMMGLTGSNIEEILPGAESLISPAVIDSYDVLYGEWPDAHDEIVLVLSENNEIAASILYKLGFLPSAEYNDLMDRMEEGEQIELEDHRWSYEQACDAEFYLIPACDTYVEGENGLFSCIADDEAEIEKLLESALKLKITGIIRPKEDADYAAITKPLAYTRALTDYIIEHTDSSAVVIAQEADPDTNILSGVKFAPKNDAEKIADTKAFVANMGVTDKAKLCRAMLSEMYAADPQMSAQFAAMGEAELAAMFDEYMKAPEDDVLLGIYEAYISTGSFDDNMGKFGVVSLEAPAAINIYSDSFENKDFIADCISRYNETADDEDKITYTDYVALLMSSVATIVNVISYVLIAFVAVSLVVSSIMIGIITYISVLERTKEIGILRAIGASKRNISQVFNAETFIIGLFAGLLGVGITLLILIPGNALIHSLTGSNDINAFLPIPAAVLLVLLSMLLTLIGGLIPAKKAARKDPVTALRTE